MKSKVSKTDKNHQEENQVINVARVYIPLFFSEGRAFISLAKKKICKK